MKNDALVDTNSVYVCVCMNERERERERESETESRFPSLFFLFTFRNARNDDSNAII
jgi:hypothetical protein